MSQHSMLTVSEGYHPCLIYNLIYTAVDECPAPVNNSKQASALVSTIEAWNEEIESGEGRKMITYILEHQYYESTLIEQSVSAGCK